MKIYSKIINLLFILPLLLNNKLNSNILLQSPKILSNDEMQQLENNWQTQFTWCFNKACKFSCFYEKSNASFIIQLFGIPIRSYNFEYIENAKKFIKSYRQNQPDYFFAKPLKIEKPNPKKISFQEFTNLLKTKNFIFYTGAGISASGKVQTMSALEKALTLSLGKKEFLKTIFFNPKLMVNEFSNFCKSAIYGAPTLAHIALHNIAQKRNICILTENVDLLHQRAGSAPIFTHSDCLYQVTDKDFNEIDVIVCIGLSHDDCGFLAYYKQKNPNGFIISIDLGIPNYLSNDDYLIQEDLQVVLCNLEKNLC